MASPYSLELLQGALLGRGLDGEGDAQQLYDRLAAALVKELLTPKRKRPADGTSAPKKSKSEWHAFMKTERPRVVESGVTGRAAIVEIARRWKLFKAVGTSSQPLSLMPPTTSDSESDAGTEGLMEALKELDDAELNASMAAYNLPIEGDVTDKLRALAEAMMA